MQNSTFVLFIRKNHFSFALFCNLAKRKNGFANVSAKLKVPSFYSAPSQSRFPFRGNPSGLSSQRIRQGRHSPTEKMTAKNQNITFDKLDKGDQIPYELLLLADPSKKLVDEYLKQSDIYTTRQNDETIGVVVLFPLTPETVEIKNVAVKPEFQGQGVGSFLIENAVQVALLNRQKSICIGTANSSVGQLY